MLSIEKIFVFICFIVISFLLLRDRKLQETFKNATDLDLLQPKTTFKTTIENPNIISTTEISQLGDSTKLKVAVVSMMRRPKDIDQWLEYHRAFGIVRFYIRLEDSEDLEEYLGNQNDITLDLGKSTGKDEYKEIQIRQCRMVDLALKKAEEDGIDWLIHIDCDELLDGDIKELQKLSEKVRTIIMNNKEAVYKDIPRENDLCFKAASFRDCASASSGCVSYVNGKAGGRVAEDVHCHGPHRFRSDRVDAEEKLVNITILHFESCDFNTYKQKFKHVAKEPKSDIPFPYYNDSVAAARKDDDSALENVFRKYRVAQK
jgi:hypothetical protein